MRPRKAPLHNPPSVVRLSNVFLFTKSRPPSCPERLRGVRPRSIPFPFRWLRTLCRNGALPTPLPSIVCALFPMQWGVRVRIPRRNRAAHVTPPASSVQKAANLPLYFQQLARCSSINSFLFILLHCCRGVGIPIERRPKALLEVTSVSGRRTRTKGDGHWAEPGLYKRRGQPQGRRYEDNVISGGTWRGGGAGTSLWAGRRRARNGDWGAGTQRRL